MLVAVWLCGETTEDDFLCLCVLCVIWCVWCFLECHGRVSVMCVYVFSCVFLCVYE